METMLNSDFIRTSVIDFFNMKNLTEKQLSAEVRKHISPGNPYVYEIWHGDILLKIGKSAMNPSERAGDRILRGMSYLLWYFNIRDNRPETSNGDWMLRIIEKYNHKYRRFMSQKELALSNFRIVLHNLDLCVETAITNVPRSGKLRGNTECISYEDTLIKRHYAFTADFPIGNPGGATATKSKHAVLAACEAVIYEIKPNTDHLIRA